MQTISIEDPHYNGFPFALFLLRFLSKEATHNPFSAREVFFSPSFWGARAYATDAGGELVRMTVKAYKTIRMVVECSL